MSASLPDSSQCSHWQHEPHQHSMSSIIGVLYRCTKNSLVWILRSLISASLPPTILAYLKFFTLVDKEVGFEKCCSPPILLLSVYVVINIIGENVPTQESMPSIIAILYWCTKNSLLDSEVCDKSICPINLQCLQVLQ